MIAGCQTPKPVNPQPTTQRWTGPIEPLDAVVARLNERNAKIASVNANGHFAGELGAKRDDLHYLNGTIELWHTKPGNARLRLFKDAAGKQFDMGTDGTVFWLWASELAAQQRTVWTGHVRPLGAAPTETLPIRPELLLDVIGIATYSLDLLAEPVPVMRFNPDYDAYMVTWQARQGDRWRAARSVVRSRNTEA
ncbi:MAG: hypothetical protein QM770_17520 [Tepidisphaeraceae bacterium]